MSDAFDPTAFDPDAFVFPDGGMSGAGDSVTPSSDAGAFDPTAFTGDPAFDIPDGATNTLIVNIFDCPGSRYGPSVIEDDDEHRHVDYLLFRFYRGALTGGTFYVYSDGTVTVDEPGDGTLLATFSGGRSYEIDPSVRSILAAAGYASNLRQEERWVSL